MIPTIKSVNTSITLKSYLFFVVRTCEIYCLSKSQAHDTGLLTAVATLHDSSYHGRFVPLTTISPFPDLLAPSNQSSTLRCCEPDSLKLPVSVSS